MTPFVVWAALRGFVAPAPRSALVAQLEHAAARFRDDAARERDLRAWFGDLSPRRGMSERILIPSRLHTRDMTVAPEMVIIDDPAPQVDWSALTRKARRGLLWGGNINWLWSLP